MKQKMLDVSKFTKNEADEETNTHSLMETYNNTRT